MHLKIRILDNVSDHTLRGFLEDEIRYGHYRIHLNGMEGEPSYYVGYLGGFPEGIPPSQMIVLVDPRSTDQQKVPEGALAINHFNFFLIDRPWTTLSLWLVENMPQEVGLLK